MTLSRLKTATYLGIACVALAAALGLYMRAKHVDQTVSRPQSDASRMLGDIQASHIDVNVPSSGDFDRFLLRDLSEYFAKVCGKTVAVTFEPLRDGPTQSGVSFPKYYLWVRLAGGESVDDRGAVRVAAVAQSRFNVTDYVSERAIRAEPREIYRVFPGPVCQRINEKLAPK